MVRTETKTSGGTFMSGIPASVSLATELVQVVLVMLSLGF